MRQSLLLPVYIVMLTLLCTNDEWCTSVSHVKLDKPFSVSEVPFLRCVPSTSTEESMKLSFAAYKQHKLCVGAIESVIHKAADYSFL